MEQQVRGARIDASGLRLPDVSAEIVDVLLDGRRVWSFRPERDLVDDRLEWPKMMRRHLDGRARVDLVDHEDGVLLAGADVAFGAGEGRARLEDGSGNLLTVDKGGRLQRTFEQSADETRAALLDAAQRVVEDLREACGIEAYLAYGCLLGAVREGRMIGHDADADLAYLSRHTHPFDLIREGLAMQAKMDARGWTTTTLSGAAFKVWVPIEGRRVGIDVFGSFYVAGKFHLMGSLRGDLGRDAILPLGTVELEGHTFPAPADPERFLEFTYGPGWRVPDPAFSFGHPPAVVRRMDVLFRRYRHRHRYWLDFYRSPAAAKVPREPSRFAQWVNDQIEPGSPVVDVGAGTGRDAVWFAGLGHPTTAMDYTASALRTIRRRARREGVELTTTFLNIEQLQRTLLTGARLAHTPEERHVYARGLLDTLAPSGRQNLWRFASMAQRRGGLLFTEFRTPASRGETMAFGQHRRTFVDPDTAVAEIERAGGTVVERIVGRGLAPLGPEDPEICRLMVRWR